MNKKELNAYIQNYVLNDKTSLAIALNGEWGIGKTYFINNELSIKDQEGNDINIVSISLYGLKTIYDLNKKIYIEYKLRNHKEVSRDNLKKYLTISGVVAKSILSLAKINVDVDDTKINTLIQNIKTSNCLLVFEDLERTSIEMKEILGFINNLVETSNVKVLIVANENELEPNAKEIFAKFKEKTILDTLSLDGFPLDGINSIMNEYIDNKYFNNFVTSQREEIFKALENDLMTLSNKNSRNLRAFRLACQKTYDYFNATSDTFDNEYAKNAFLSIVEYWIKSKLKDYDEKNQKYTMPISINLFLKNNIILKTMALDDNKQFVDSRKKMNEEVNQKEYLDKIYTYYFYSDEVLEKSLNSLLESAKRFEFKNASNIMRTLNFLVSIKHNVSNYEGLVDNCIKELKKNIKKINIKDEKDLRFYSGISLDSSEQSKEMKDIENEIKEYIKANRSDTLISKCNIDSIDDFIKYINDNSDKFITNKKFASLLDMDKTFNLIRNGKSYQIASLRDAFRSVYSFSNLDEFFSSDRESLEYLKEKLEEYEKEDIDKVVRLQIRYFISNISNYLDLLK